MAGLKNVGWEIAPFAQSREAATLYVWKEEAWNTRDKARRTGVDNTMISSVVTGGAALLINPLFGAFTLIWTGFPFIKGVANWRASTHLTRAIETRAKLIESLYYMMQLKAGIEKQLNDLKTAPQKQRKAVASKCVEQWKESNKLFEKIAVDNRDPEMEQELKTTRSAVVKTTDPKQLEPLLKTCIGKKGSLGVFIDQRKDDISRNARYYNHWVAIV